MKIKSVINPVLHIEVTLSELFANYLESIQDMIKASEGDLDYSDFEWPLCALLKGVPNQITDLFSDGSTMMLLPSLMDEIEAANEIVLTVVDKEGNKVVVLDENDLVY